VVGFFLQTREIREAVGDPTSRDVVADLAVLADGVEVAPPVPFTLVRQPTAILEAPAPFEPFLSVLGGTRVVLRVSSLRAARLDEFAMFLVTLNPADPRPDINAPRGFLARECTNLAVKSISTGDGLRVDLVSGDAPANNFPGQVGFLVHDTVAGFSTIVGQLFYTPEFGVASPVAGPTDGGTLVALSGQAMVPLDFNVTGPAVLDFDQVSILFSKGGRELALPPSDLRREESSLNRLVFPMSPSPDGRSGPVTVVLKVLLDFLEVETEGSFFYGHRSLNFGPRGAVLNEAPLTMEMASLEEPPSSGREGGEDAVLLTDVGGVPMVQLYAADENGMFTRYGLPLQAGNTSDLAQRDPVDLSSGNFDSDSLEDLLVINRGLGTVARHTLVLGQDEPAPPLLLAGPAIVVDHGARLGLSGDLNGDGADDVVVLPGPQASSGSPEVLLAMPTGPGDPGFVSKRLPQVGSGPFEAMSLEDLDGDGILDLILATGGSSPVVVTAYGTGDDGQFEGVQTVDLAQSIPGYTPDVSSGSVGVHACGGTPASIAVVFAGIPGSGITEPTVAVLAPAGPRTHAPPTATGVLTIARADAPLGHSLAADLDEDGLPELILAASGESAEPLRLLVWQGEGFSQTVGGVETGVERPLDITSLRVGVAVPGVVPQLGVFITHRVRVDSFEEHRLSTWLVAPGPKLLAADASGEVDVPIRGMTGGNLTQSSSPLHRDLAVASTAPEEILILANDGLGTMSEFVRVQVPGILSETLTAAALPLAPGVVAGSHSLVCLRGDGRLEVLVPLPGEARPGTVSIDLDPIMPAHLRALPVSGTSKVGSGDVDGDGLEDLIVLLRFAGLGEPEEGDALLVLLRGRSPGVPGGSPLHAPETGASVHGNASAFAIGDFALERAGLPARQEVAVAVPRGSPTDPLGGNHVRFFRYQTGATPAGDHFVASPDSDPPQVLLAGSEPAQLRAADVDGNGVDDLLVSSGGDSRLRLFLNGGIQVTEGEVNIATFREGFATPRNLPPGEPTGMISTDLNGDNAIDVLVVTRQPGPALEHSVAYYLSTGLGDLDGPYLIPMSRTGNRVGDAMVARDAEMVFFVGDLNRDGRVDMAFGWDTAGPDDRNLRMLFGGSR
jgi:hypothetical protein